MMNEQHYRALAHGAMQARAETDNDFVAEAHGRAAASFATAARSVKLAARKVETAQNLRRLANRHFQRGNRRVASELERRAVLHETQAAFLATLVDAHEADAAAQQIDARDATDPKQRRKRPSSDSTAENEEKE